MPPSPEPGIRRVMHCDLDCFFAAVEELDNPRLRGKPVIVGGDPDRRGVVSTANYVARRFGVHSAMAAAVARRLCPHGVFLRPRFDRYRELSQRVMAILDDYCDIREQVSVDEAYGELPPGVPGCRKAEALARDVKARVLAETGLVISVGVARSRSLAKLASDFGKPDGCVIVRPHHELAFLHPLPVGRLSGVGPHTRERLERLGIATVGQLAATPLATLEHRLGKHGRWLWELANARDERPVVGEHAPPKSVSREPTYERDIADLERAREKVRWLAGEVERRATRDAVKGRTVTLKVRWSDFSVTSRQRALAEPTDDAETIAGAAASLLDSEIAPHLGSDFAIRLLGIGLSGFAGNARDSAALVQLRLFGLAAVPARPLRKAG
jgi:DNA polymerase IV